MGLMAPAEWAKLKIVRKEGPGFNWGNPDKIDFDLANLLDEFCLQHSLSPVVTSGTQGKHLVDSEHYLGRACDVMFPKLTLKELPDVFLKALTFLSQDGKHFGGIGIYNQWRIAPGLAPIGGMHFDTRLDKKGHIETWVWTSKGMIPTSLANLTENFQ